MTIEVRQLQINASVGMPVQRAQDPGALGYQADEGQEDELSEPFERLREQLREQLLAELKDWLEDRLSRIRER